ncbi:hypothetical protein A3762_06335 [Oleiphilus sp. HI0125]|uniref:hypothetical protein n=1 Tax=Oleiphilus sp. HI0125 TaxID=1822266 RepID=UPI0007C345D0|nr:hypothetical protein [Oleiphilus sp. HI0125]KZZ59026.1 hypothetical protein A3762_06335 [Oleiphilus sp. HI0125]
MKTTSQVIQDLNEIQSVGVTLEEATLSYHKKEEVSFEEIWPAILQILETDETHAKELATQWCTQYD